MNTIKKNIVRSLGLVALATLLIASPDAQARRGHHGHGDRALIAQLDLSPEQEQTIQEILKSTRQQKRSIFQNDELSREEKHEALHALREASKASVQAVLTEEQQQELAQLQAERMAARIDRKVERMTEKLSLEEAQADAIKVILTEAQGQKREIRSSEGTREEKRGQLEALKEQTSALILEQLNEEQAEQFQAQQQRRERRRARGPRRGRRG